MSQQQSESINVAQIADALETMAPARYAASWDNTGLLLGGREWPATQVMLTIDLTPSVLDEAIHAGVNMIIAYHPPLFAPIKRLTDDDPKQHVLLRAARHGIAIHSPHTALDAAPDGVNDWVASGLGDGDRRALVSHENLPPSEAVKIVTFCPADAVDRIRNGLASVGAGRIGDYERCSFTLDGTGTFQGGSATTPAVGRAGRLERVEEIRLEMVCSHASLALAVTTLRGFHPYETPPIEIHPLLPRPERHIGEGRRIVLDRRVTLRELAERVKTHLGIDAARIAPVGTGGSRKISTIGLCVGAGGALLGAAIEQGCEAFITGEMRHHDVLDAQARNCAVVLAGHTNTERGYLKVLQRRLRHDVPDVNVLISRRDADPLRAV